VFGDKNFDIFVFTTSHRYALCPRLAIGAHFLGATLTPLKGNDTFKSKFVTGMPATSNFASLNGKSIILDQKFDVFFNTVPCSVDVPTVL
jgi:hypothetical protein